MDTSVSFQTPLVHPPCSTAQFWGVQGCPVPAVSADPDPVLLQR